MLLLAVALLAGQAAMPQAMSGQERTMRKKLAKGKAYPAIRIANGMLAKPGHPVFYLLRAEAFNSISEFRKAEADARMAVQLLPDSMNGLIQLALAEQGQGLLDSAYRDLTLVIQHSPGIEAHYRRALVGQLQGRLPEARADIDQALALARRTGAATAALHRVKGELAAMAGDTVLARTQLDSAVALAPRDPVNYNSRGFYGHAFHGDHIGAIREYDRAIKLNPNYSYAFNNRGWSYYKTGQVAKGINDIDRARRKKPQNPYIYRNLGIIALETGDTAKACVLFRQALDREFTALYGHEVEDRMAASCKASPAAKPLAPVQAPQGTLDRPSTQPVQRTNAP